MKSIIIRDQSLIKKITDKKIFCIILSIDENKKTAFYYNPEKDIKVKASYNFVCKIV